MADLVAEVAEQRAVGLVHLDAALSRIGVVGLGEVERDDAVLVAGHHRRAAGQRAQQVEHQAALRVLVDAATRDAAGPARSAATPGGVGQLDAAPQFAAVVGSVGGRGWCGSGGSATARASAPDVAASGTSQLQPAVVSKLAQRAVERVAVAVARAGARAVYRAGLDGRGPARAAAS